MLSRCARQLSRHAWAPVGSWPTCGLLPAPPLRAHAAPRRSHSLGSSRKPAVQAATAAQTAWPPDVEASEQSAEMHAQAVPSIQELEARIGQLSTRPTVRSTMLPALTLLISLRCPCLGRPGAFGSAPRRVMWTLSQPEPVLESPSLNMCGSIEVRPSRITKRTLPGAADSAGTPLAN